jgi:hypothetical protein
MRFYGGSDADGVCRGSALEFPELAEIWKFKSGIISTAPTMKGLGSC